MNGCIYTEKFANMTLRYNMRVNYTNNHGDIFNIMIAPFFHCWSCNVRLYYIQNANEMAKIIMLQKFLKHK